LLPLPAVKTTLLIGCTKCGKPSIYRAKKYGDCSEVYFTVRNVGLKELWTLLWHREYKNDW
ncbi:MAG: hypothetical protein ACYSTT_06500, partial [Planctomycetota bacterium]